VDLCAHGQTVRRIAGPELADWEAEGILNQHLAYRNAYHVDTFLDNHDTPRFFHLAGGEKRAEEAMVRTRLALTFLLTTRGIPQLYYGSELAMEGGLHPDNRRDLPWELIEQPDLDTPEAARAREMLAFTR